MRAYFSIRELTGVEAQILMCCETRSERQKAGVLESLLGEDPDLVYYLAAFVTPDWLVWARSGDHTKSIVVAAKLKEIHVRPMTFLTVKDTGMKIDGFVDGAFSKIHGHLSLGPEPVAQEFCKTVAQAIGIVNPPRRLLDLFGKRPQ
jgi:hypothetical protein